MSNVASQQTIPTIPDISDVHLAFGRVDFLPMMADLPAEYRSQSALGCEFADAYFFGGSDRVNQEFTLYIRPEVGDRSEMAFKAFRAAMASFLPKHEHKIAACGWLMDQWFVVRRKGCGDEEMAS